MIMATRTLKSLYVLIDTWWNVNTVGVGREMEEKSF